MKQPKDYPVPKAERRPQTEPPPLYIVVGVILVALTVGYVFCVLTGA